MTIRHRLRELIIRKIFGGAAGSESSISKIDCVRAGTHCGADGLRAPGGSKQFQHGVLRGKWKYDRRLGAFWGLAEAQRSGLGGKAGARERTNFRPQTEMKSSGLCAAIRRDAVTPLRLLSHRKPLCWVFHGGFPAPGKPSTASDRPWAAHPLPSYLPYAPILSLPISFAEV